LAVKRTQLTTRTWRRVTSGFLQQQCLVNLFPARLQHQHCLERGGS